MRHQLAPAAATVLAAAALGIGGGTGAVTAAQTAPAASDEQEDEKRKCPPEREKDDGDGGDRGDDEEEPGIGDPLRLEDAMNEVSVSVVDVVDPAEPKDDFVDSPAEGNRLVSVQFCVENTGDERFQDPFLYAEVTDTKGQSFEVPYLVSEAGPHFPLDTITASPGDFALGFITFEVPEGSELDTVRYEMPGLEGFSDGDISGEWDISEEEQREADAEHGPPVN
jgi:hypothetical protein